MNMAVMPADRIIPRVEDLSAWDCLLESCTDLLG